MDDDLRELYERLEKDTQAILNKISNDVCKVLITMSNEEQKFSLSKLSTKRLKDYYKVAYQSEYYEICQNIKEIFEGKNIEI